MKNKRVLGLSILCILLIINLFYTYVFKSSHRNITTETAAFSIEASALHSLYTVNELISNQQYLDKPIAISGDITMIENSTIILNKVVQVQFINKPKGAFRNKVAITVKGRCLGYDNLLDLVKIDQAILINKDN